PLANKSPAPPEADLQPQIIHWCCKQRTQVGRRGFGQIDCEPRRQRIEQRRLARLERVALAAAEEGACRRWCVAIHHSSCPACRASASCRCATIKDVAGGGGGGGAEGRA